jgi:SET domain-containing protein
VYKHEYVRERLHEDDVMICSCSINSGHLCDDRCQARAVQQECSPSTCPCGQLCMNRPFSNLGPTSTLPLQVFKTLTKGWGVKATRDFAEGDLVVEYVGEVIDADMWEARKRAQWRFDHFYFMALNQNEIVDGSRKGNIARFINHSCSPNLQVEKWYVNRTPRLGLWAKRPIAAGEELSYNYSVKWHGNPDHRQKCYCGASNCTGFLGRAPSASTKKH